MGNFKQTTHSKLIRKRIITEKVKYQIAVEMFVITTFGLVGKFKIAAKIRGFQPYILKKKA